MNIENGNLLKIDDTDILSDGSLFVPEGVTEVEPGTLNNCDKVKKIYFPNSLTKICEDAFNNNKNLTFIDFGKNVKRICETSFKGCDNIATIKVPMHWQSKFINFFFSSYKNINKLIRTYPNNRAKEYKICRCNGAFYIEQEHRKIGNVEIITLNLPIFSENGISNIAPSYLLKVNNKEFFCLVQENIFPLANQQLILNHFKKVINQYLPETPEKELIEHILKKSLQMLLDEKDNISCKGKKELRNYEKQLPKIINAMQEFIKKYPNCKTFEELQGLDFEELKSVLLLNKQEAKYHNLNKRVKKRPVFDYDMYDITADGHKEIGSLPYNWLEKIPVFNRGKATKNLRKALINTTRTLYSPAYSLPDMKILEKGELEKLSALISKETKQSAKIKYFSSGHFSKAYLIEFPNNNKYIWKIYHSDLPNREFRQWRHDTEIQNSFLLSGKKYYGKLLFRTISAGSLSSQRGERYSIYKFIENNPNKPKNDPYEKLKRFYLYDLLNEDNCQGNIVTDLGAINITEESWNQEKYITKIKNSIIYHSWDSLSYVLKNYTKPQIEKAINFIQSNIDSKTINQEQIFAKLTFLRNKLISRNEH